MKKCSNCLKILDFNEFNKNVNTKDGFRYICRLCQINIYYRDNLEHCKKIKAIWQQKNKEKISKKAALYKKENPGKIRANKAKYRAAKLLRTPKWLTKKHFDEMRKIYDFCPSGQVVDHIVPLRGVNVSGLHVPWNLQYLTNSENCSKKNSFKSQ